MRSKFAVVCALGLAAILAGCAAPNENRNNQEIGNKMEAEAKQEKQICTALGDINCAQQ
ncbi:hypothetical protein MD535_20195 [Vibrio sp. ZSDZ65]|uniref:Lipoprotein n=1 Tax=Vibrio qingdaonensis TaxID=2829491 RepID=A0A9X3CRB1_9VIBR|nr:hypothetical protein [Vibrio qingdaonensis]MCW8348311.1 hypothetical protein [Vibrio qingdaonensis]